MNYQRFVCWGDSQTFGARTYGCYPLYLVRELNASTRYRWSVINLSSNGHTARDLWFRIGRESSRLHDCYRACVMIGANDVANETPVNLFHEYYAQLLDTLAIAGVRIVHCGEITPFFADGHSFFPRESVSRRDEYNDAMREAVDACAVAVRVEFPDLTADCFVDPAHLSEEGNRVVAAGFAASIRST